MMLLLLEEGRWLLDSSDLHRKVLPLALDVRLWCSVLSLPPFGG
jgi:hypothetical protein